MGLFGPPGSLNVAWGDFAHFEKYTAIVNAFVPHALVPTLAVSATTLESLFGIALVLGIFTRLIAIASAILLGLFAVAMSISLGIKAPLDYSVFSAWAAAMLLAERRAFSWSIDALITRNMGGQRGTIGHVRAER